LVILEKQVAGLNEHTLERFVLRARRSVGLRGTVNVLVTGSSAVRSLNQRFRRQNKVTDVLSFPAIPPYPTMTSPAESRRQAKLAGEIAISADIARKNSFRLGHSVAQEVKVLALHGILHLAGFDHERDNGEMARKEMNLRGTLRLPSGLIERSQPGRGLSKSGKMEPVRQTSGKSSELRRAAPKRVTRTA
jgi:probable rRNA maturation factor